MDRLRDILLLCLLGLLAYLPGIASLPVIDRDEARYAQSVVQMVETGDYVDIRFQEEPRYKKPIGAYWAQAAAIHLTGQADDVRAGERPIWAQRLPSILGALVAVVFTYLAGVALLGRRAAFLGAAMLAVSVSLVFEAHQAKTDALLAGCAAVVLWGIAVRSAWGVWIGIALGMLVKGPVIVGVAGLALATIAVVERSGSRLRELARPLPILLAVAIALPWFVAIGLKTDGAFFAEALGRDFGAKLGSAQETHGGWPGYYLLTTLVMFWPGVIALPLAGVWAWRERRLPEVALLLAWLVPMWVVLEVVPTKLPHYTLPLYPALALLCGGAVVAVAAGKWIRTLGGLLFALPLLLFAAVLGLLAAHNPYAPLGSVLAGALSPTGAQAVLSAVPVFLAVAIAPWLARRILYQESVGALAVASLFAVMVVLVGGSRVFRELDLYAAMVIADGADGARVVSPDFREPSLVYLAGTETRLDLDRLRPGDVLVVADSDFSQEPKRPRCSTVLRRLDAYNYAKGDPVVGTINATDGCEASELETWRAREAARRRENG